MRRPVPVIRRCRPPDGAAGMSRGNGSSEFHTVLTVPADDDSRARLRWISSCSCRTRRDGMCAVPTRQHGVDSHRHAAAQACSLGCGRHSPESPSQYPAHLPIRRRRRQQCHTPHQPVRRPVSTLPPAQITGTKPPIERSNGTSANEVNPDGEYEVHALPCHRPHTCR